MFSSVDAAGGGGVGETGRTSSPWLAQPAASSAASRVGRHSGTAEGVLIAALLGAGTAHCCCISEAMSLLPHPPGAPCGGTGPGTRERSRRRVVRLRVRTPLLRSHPPG